MRLKLLLSLLVVVIVTFTAKTVLANKQQPNVWNGCTIASDSVCSGVDISGFGFYYLTPRLTGFTCTNCYMRGAGMWSINLTGSNFFGSDLSQASFAHANLTGVNFSGANLTDTMLTNAKITGGKQPNYTGAILCRTTMPDGTKNSSSCP